MFLSLLDLMRQAGALADGAAGAGVQIDLTDQGGHLQVVADLPGIDPQSVQIQVAETALALGGARTVEERTEGPSFYRVQASRQSFYRELPLPSHVDPHRATATWQTEGRLILTLPKT